MLEAGFKRWLASTDTVILVCWDLGHIWDADIYDTVERVRHGSYVMTGHCQRGCDVQRTRWLASDWSPDSNRNTYKYPRGYSPKDFAAKGETIFMSWEHRAAIRQELARRSKEREKRGDKKNVVVKFKAPGA